MGVDVPYWSINWSRYEVCLGIYPVLLIAHVQGSVKMIGLFVTALVGIYTIEDLWDKFGDSRLAWVCV